jgi:hypothetical protein
MQFGSKCGKEASNGAKAQAVHIERDRRTHENAAMGANKYHNPLDTLWAIVLQNFHVEESTLESETEEAAAGFGFGHSRPAYDSSPYKLHLWRAK